MPKLLQAASIIGNVNWLCCRGAVCESSTWSSTVPNATEHTSEVVSKASITDMPAMLSIDDAMAQLSALVNPIDSSETVALADARNRTLADDVHAPVSLPPFNSSAMDGYAVKAQDCENLGTTLKVVGTSFAGTPFNGPVATQQAIRIFTGAAVPPDTDAVVIQEDVERTDDRIVLQERVELGDNIRRIGHDVQKGELLLGQGSKLSAFEITWLAACGVPQVTVTKAIRVAMFSTGDELQDPDKPLAEGQIYDSNRAALKELLRSKPVLITDLGRLPDDPVAIERAIKSVQSETDLILTSGGVSVGDADYVRPIIEQLGELAFWNVALKPGKPIAVGKVGSAWFLGLPGNPVSTIVTYLLFVTRVIDALCGMSPTSPLAIPARLMETLRHSVGRREYQRGILSRSDNAMVVVPAGDQSSNRLSTITAANCLIVVPEDVGAIAEGTVVDVLLLPREANHLFQAASSN